jgi:MarR family 2-MHQ and catechol resistance regulon transcriptional repressor
MTLRQGRHRVKMADEPFEGGGLTGPSRPLYGWHMQLTAPVSAKEAARRTLQEDAIALHEAVSHLVRVYQFRDRDKICCYDVSVTQCYALEALARTGPMRSLALAGLLRLDKSTITRVIDALVRKGYVERRPDAEDSRALSLRITRSGRALYEKINRQLVAQQAEVIADLDPEVRLAAAGVIQRLARAAEARFRAGVSVGTCRDDGDASEGCC